MLGTRPRRYPGKNPWGGWSGNRLWAHTRGGVVDLWSTDNAMRLRFGRRSLSSLCMTGSTNGCGATRTTCSTPLYSIPQPWPDRREHSWRSHHHLAERLLWPHVDASLPMGPCSPAALSSRAVSCRASAWRLDSCQTTSPLHLPQLRRKRGGPITVSTWPFRILC
ncbi:hypothetical protein EJ04DRAFT_59922 [Polyplosphaeria fusca]|uniref:Uncharacterized protein n=1 Tax=Polyplosphaeria fusca TaxID=682080 RepID=A0A9P4V673_9PLEO|nr:hypothetical protein EJ04DRAFT_59922 [Polyplosphaeria fusca]